MGHRRQLERIIEAALTCLIAGALTFCTFVGVSAAQSQRQQLIAAAKMNCHTTRAQLEETQLPNLRRRHTAFDTLLIDWKEKMPPQHRQNIPIQLQDGLKFEIAALQLLVLSHDALEHVIRACEALTEQVGPEMIAPLAIGFTAQWRITGATGTVEAAAAAESGIQGGVGYGCRANDSIQCVKVAKLHRNESGFRP